MFTKNLSDLPSVYEQKYKYKFSTTLQDNMTGALRSAECAAASAVNNTLGRLVKGPAPDQFFGKTPAKGDRILGNIQQPDNYDYTEKDNNENKSPSRYE